MPGRQYSAISEGPQWKMVVGRDAIVLVINSRNPFLNEIVRQGISAEEFSQIIKNPDKVKRGEHILTIIQKGKRLIISAPLSGFIRAENTILFTDSSLINSSPYVDGWIYLIEPTNWLRETQFLFMAEQYTEWLKNEFSRLKDFLATAIKPNAPEYAYVILQDGGEITDHLLENLGPEVWEEFQTNFIDTSK